MKYIFSKKERLRELEKVKNKDYKLDNKLSFIDKIRMNCLINSKKILNYRSVSVHSLFCFKISVKIYY